AAPRAVAVIDTSAGAATDPEITALAARLEAQLGHETGLMMAPAERRPALVGAIPDETVGATTEAAGELERGRDALSRFDESTAIDDAAKGLVRAASLPPTPVVDELIADLAFVRGLAELDGAPDAAVRDFALVRRL